MRLLLALLLTCAAPSLMAASTDATVNGVVRDPAGVPQMGALIQVLAADATVMATAFTDGQGRYMIPAVVPGRYRLRASAAFFAPTTHDNLRLRPGGQTTVDLTVSSLFELSAWLPVQSRRAGEPADDWKWALRAATTRPLLRLADPVGGTPTDPERATVSSSAEQAHARSAETRLSVTSGDGQFGEGGLHQRFAVTESTEDGDVAIVMADLGEPELPFASAPSSEVAAGYERRGLLGSSTRAVVSYTSHPELGNVNQPGLQAMRVATAERVQLGDAVQIDAGTLLLAERLASLRVLSAPFVRGELRLTPQLTVEYRYATARELQSADDLDHIAPRVVALASADGKPLNSFGTHHEVSATQRLGEHDTLQVTAYMGKIHTTALTGSGALQPADLEGAALLADPSTATFRLAGPGMADRGLSAMLAHNLTAALSLTAALDYGTAVERQGTGPESLLNAATLTRTASSPAASVSVRGRVLRSGTAVRAQYRWQQQRTLTQVNSYNASENDAYLSFYLRQRIRCGHLLPNGLDAVVEATNLLEQGYQPLIASDGHTLYLAQVPRSVEGGFSFTF